MNSVKYIISITCVLILSSCWLTSVTGRIPYTKILFGKGGGFTGKYQEYFILNNGNLYSKSATKNSFSKTHSLSAKETKTIFAMIDTYHLFETAFNNPYNYSYYIEIVKGDVSNRIVWGDNKNPPPEGALALFNKLIVYTASEPKNPQKRGSNGTKK